MGLTDRERNTEQLSLRISKEIITLLDRVVEVMNHEFPGIGFCRADAARTCLKVGADKFLVGDEREKLVS